MRDQDKDLDLPSFGPAEREPNGATTDKKAAQATPAEPVTVSAGSGNGSGSAATVQAGGGSGNGLSYLIILLLAAAVAGLAYWGYMQHQQLLTLEQQRQETDQKVLELQQLLQVAEDSAAESGESLLSQVKGMQVSVKKLTATAEQTHKELASEVGKLWVVSHQRNTPKIAELEKQLKSALAKLDTQAKTAKNLNSQLSAQTKQFDGIKKQLATAKANDKAAAEKMASVKQSVASLGTEFQILSESVELQQADQRKKLSAFAEQIVALQSNQNASAGLERRVKVNEQAVRAIDGSRILLNKELLQIRQKLNNLQLQVESF